MKIAILYDSATGNTAYLAEALHKAYEDLYENRHFIR